ncbi:MAG: NACHT domain-containing protein [Acetobacteraceae bacterium]|nr:NACHT domain-containing protein [Acetobacteraceae bacterium]
MIESSAVNAAISATIVNSATTLIRKALEKFGEALLGRMTTSSRSLVDKMVVGLKIGLQDYLELSYRRCELFKTLLDPSTPISVKDHYVHVTLAYGKKHISDDELIKNVSKYKSVVLTGLAGSGKSMLMKSLTLHKFEFNEGRLPIFVELRHTNQLTKCDLLTFIRSHCASKSSAISEDQFQMALRSGCLTLILDGFDEVILENRDDLQRQILEIRKDYPAATIIISSRPDSRFAGWTAFHIFNVDSLTRTQCLRLIDTLAYEKDVKNRFKKSVEERLYASHKSFLSSPLLTTIMLLTFEEFADVPDRMHAFYSQAFDTLLHKHDAFKEQFVRKTRTGMTKEEFRHCFSAFCAMSYLEERISFSEAEVLTVAKKSIDYARQRIGSIKETVTADDFVCDLRDAICIMQPDGTELTFVHRSFQEYFAALFVVHSLGTTAKKILDKYACRFGDSVIPMALEMDRENIEQNWVLPTIAHLKGSIFDAHQQSLASQYISVIPKFALHIVNGRVLTGVAKISPLVGPLESLKASYPGLLKYSLPVFSAVAYSNLKKLFSDENIGKDISGNSAKIRALLQSGGEAATDSGGGTTLTLTPADEWWLRAMGIEELLREVRQGLEAIKQEIQMREIRRADILDEVFEAVGDKKPRPTLSSASVQKLGGHGRAGKLAKAPERG